MKTKQRRIDLGLEILLATRTTGKRYNHREIAAYCGCTWANIWLIERKALRKMKRAARKIGLEKGTLPRRTK